MENLGIWKWKDIKKTTSTNDAVKSFYDQIQSPCILSAQEQTAGRGRRAHLWQSMSGNLFMSFAFEIDQKEICHMVILSGLAVFNTIKYYAPQADLKLKWPNDVLANDKKISGILFEHYQDSVWVMGIGINVCSSPVLEKPDYETTSIKQLGITVERTEVLKRFVREFDSIQTQYRQNGFETLRKSWLDKAYNLGKTICIREENGFKQGIFTNLDAQGRLCLLTPTGEDKIIAGDFMKEKEKNV